MYELIGARGSGSMIVELLLHLSGAPHSLTEMVPWEDGPHIAELKKLNPLGQVPVLRLPDGRLMTESGAIALYLCERHPELASLVPAADAPERADFLRWLFFFTGSIYPTFTVGDHPERWTEGPGAPEALKRSTDSYREMLWRHVEASAGQPFMLGGRMSLLDLYIAVMNPWRPRTAWFAANCPRLSAIAARVRADERLVPVFQRSEGH
ncbi:MAG TPA: glutathione S-transferase family protein [Azospirillaceae bacterium]|nr:glutathione S-transferase family protein [Azospirillaceae bacterium]